MQNKGFVRVFAILLTLVCLYYLSFSFVTRKYYKEAAEYANGSSSKESFYLDSLANKKVWFGAYTLKQCREMEVTLGLDLKGGMNVVLELNVPDVIRSLANNSQDVNFNKALESAYARQATSQRNFVDLFAEEYKKLDPGAHLSALFSTFELKEKINPQSSDDQVVSVLKEELQSAIDNSFNVLRTRIDRFGVVSPNIQRLETAGRILVELPGVKEPARVRKLLQGSANLEFWETYNLTEINQQLMAADQVLARVLTPVSAEADTTAASVPTSESAVQTDTMASQATDSLIAQLGGEEQQTPEANMSLEEYAKQHPLFALLQLNVDPTGRYLIPGPVAGYARKTDMEKISEYLNMPQVKAVLPNNIIFRWGVKAMDENDQFYQLYALKVTNRDGTPAMSGDVVTNAVADFAQQQIGRSQYQVSMTMNAEGAREWARLTKENIKRSIAIVLDGMVYSAPTVQTEITGGQSQITGDFTLASFQAVLTLPGIAGMVLTLGMAVDANVLIYERTKEELRNGKQLAKAIADGYSNAFSAIFDANLTTVITGIVLFVFGTGPIRGFATTLIIGLIASFLTAVFLTRLVYEALLAKDKIKHLTFTTPVSKNILTDPKVNFLGKRKIGYLIPLIIIVLGMVSMFTVGLNNGIDFTGGRNYVIRFDKDVRTDEIRSALEPQLQGGSVGVITIGSQNQVRVSTNYRIADNAQDVDDDITGKLYAGLQSFLPEGTTFEQFTSDHIQSSQKVGPSMADDIKNSAFMAVIFAMFCMALYILVRFRDVAFSIGVFVSVAVTTLCIIAFYTLLWKIMPFSMEVDQTFIAAILTVIGYSINDTVVVFDRIRETIQNYPKRDRYQVINDSLNSTLARTFSTSISTFIVVFIIFLLGGSTIQSFTFAILLGVIVGTYSTLFVATPIAYEIQKRKFKTAEHASAVAATA